VENFLTKTQFLFQLFSCPLLKAQNFLPKELGFVRRFLPRADELKKISSKLDPISVVKSTRAMTIQNILFQHFFALLVTCTLLAFINGFEPERKVNKNIIQNIKNI